MLDKLLAQLRAQRSLKRVCIFFLAFAASLTVMGSSHDVFYGNGSQMMPEEIRTAQDGAAAQKTEQKPTTELMAAVKAVNLEEIVITAVADKKDEAKAESKTKAKAKAEDEEEASDEADSTETKKKSSAKAKKDTAEDEEAAAEESEPDNFVYSDQIPMSLELQKYTFAKCEERGLEYELVLAIIWRESRFKVDAVHVNTNGTRDNGIMQINDVNRKWLQEHYGITDLMDPYQNIDAGTAMLGRLTNKYGSHNAMMAYQYGEGGMAKKLKQGVTTSTAIEQAYKQRDHYRKII